MEEELQALLSSVAPAFLGESPQGTLRPYVVLRVVSQARPLTQEGLRPGLVRSRVQVDCYGATYARGVVLARSVIAAVEGRRAGRFALIAVDAVRDLTGPDSLGAGAAHRRAVDLMIHYRE